MQSRWWMRWMRTLWDNIHSFSQSVIHSTILSAFYKSGMVLGAGDKAGNIEQPLPLQSFCLAEDNPEQNIRKASVSSQTPSPTGKGRMLPEELARGTTWMWRERGVSHAKSGGQSILGRGNSMCKGHDPGKQPSVFSAGVGKLCHAVQMWPVSWEWCGVVYFFTFLLLTKE